MFAGMDADIGDTSAQRPRQLCTERKRRGMEGQTARSHPQDPGLCTCLHGPRRPRGLSITHPPAHPSQTSLPGRRAAGVLAANPAVLAWRLSTRCRLSQLLPWPSKAADTNRFAQKHKVEKVAAFLFRSGLGPLLPDSERTASTGRCYWTEGCFASFVFNRART